MHNRSTTSNSLHPLKQASPKPNNPHLNVLPPRPQLDRFQPLPELSKTHMALSMEQKSPEQIQKQKRSFIGQKGRDIAYECYEAYRSKKSNLREMKVSFCRRLIGEVFWPSLANTPASKNNQVSVNTINQSMLTLLTFLLSKYPQSYNKTFDPEFSRLVLETKQDKNPYYEILKNMEACYISREETRSERKRQALFRGVRKSYLTDIKQLFNNLILESRRMFPWFRQKMARLFETHGGPEVHYLIGTKFSESAQLYGDEELVDNQRITIHNPESLRVLIKWYEELSSFFDDLKDSVLNRSEPFKSRNDRLKRTIKLDEQKKRMLFNWLKKQNQELIKPCLQLLRQHLNMLVTDITRIIENSSHPPELSVNDTRVGRSAQLISTVLPDCLGTMISQFISVLNSLETYNNSLSEIDLLTFSVFDLLRCKCSDTKQNILKIYKALMEQSSSEKGNNQDFQVVRVKNRLNTGTRDVLINLKINYENSFLICQVQLAIATGDDEISDHFNHFLYQLKRSPFGPFVEAGTLLNYLQPESIYWKNLRLKPNKSLFKTIIDEMKKQSADGFSWECLSCNNKTALLEKSSQNSPWSMICYVCQATFSSQHHFVSSLTCQHCGLKVCGNCVISYSPESYAEMIISQYVEETLPWVSKYFRRKDFLLQSDNIEQDLECKYLAKGEYCLVVWVSQGKSVSYTIARRLTQSGKIVHFYSLFTQSSHDLIPNNCPKLLFVPRLTPQVVTFKQAWNKGAKFNFPSKPLCRDLNMISQIKICGCNLMILRQYQDSRAKLASQKSRQRTIKVPGLEDAQSSWLVIDCVFQQSLLLAREKSYKIDKIIGKYNKESGPSTLNIPQLSLISNQLFVALEGIKKKKSVKILNLRHNLLEDAIQIIGQSGLEALQELQLRQNKLTSVRFSKGYEFTSRLSRKPKANSSVAFQFLRELNLSLNLIRSLDLFAMPSLRFLDVSQNQITHLHPSSPQAKDLPVLEDLQLQHNLIESAEFIMLNIGTLKTLNLSNNRISSLDTSLLSNMSELTFLDLACNRLSGSISDLKLPKLEMLVLSYNSISSLGDVDLPELRQLRVNNNQITHVKYLKSKALIKLDASHNLITECLFLLGLYELEYLHLNHNSISSIVLTFNAPYQQEMRIPGTRLKQVYLDHNLIKHCKLWQNVDNMDDTENEPIKSSIFSLEDSLMGYSGPLIAVLPELQVLSLQGNQVQTFGRVNCPRLLSLDLRSNRIKDPSELISRWVMGSIREIKLEDNPWELEEQLVRETAVMLEYSIALAAPPNLKTRN